MFWIAFVWGLGVSSGACFGLLMFFVLKSGLDWIVNSKSYKSLEEFNVKSLEALQDRNVLAKVMISHLEVIAASSQLSDEAKKDTHTAMLLSRRLQNNVNITEPR